MSLKRITFLSVVLLCGTWVVAQSAPSGGARPSSSSAGAGQQTTGQQGQAPKHSEAANWFDYAANRKHGTLKHARLQPYESFSSGQQRSTIDGKSEHFQYSWDPPERFSVRNCAEYGGLARSFDSEQRLF